MKLRYLGHGISVSRAYEVNADKSRSSIHLSPVVCTHTRQLVTHTIVSNTHITSSPHNRSIICLKSSATVTGLALTFFNDIKSLKFTHQEGLMDTRTLLGKGPVTKLILEAIYNAGPTHMSSIRITRVVHMHLIIDIHQSLTYIMSLILFLVLCCPHTFGGKGRGVTGLFSVLKIAREQIKYRIHVRDGILGGSSLS